MFIYFEVYRKKKFFFFFVELVRTNKGFELNINIC